jgi:hypothetical protein
MFARVRRVAYNCPRSTKTCAEHRTHQPENTTGRQRDRKKQLVEGWSETGQSGRQRTHRALDAGDLGNEVRASRERAREPGLRQRSLGLRQRRDILGVGGRKQEPLEVLLGFWISPDRTGRKEEA